MAVNPVIPEQIFVQTDLAFSYILEAIKELNDQGRLEVQHVQTANLERIQSDNNDDDFKHRFGVGNNTSKAAFGRTASAIIRMTMLEAVKVNRTFWPRVGHRGKSGSRNENSLGFKQLFPNKPNAYFSLTHEKQEAKKYWTKYDHLYPHFLIETKVGENRGKWTYLPTMMLIFRNNFTESIEITTNVRAKMLPADEAHDEFDSKVLVVCIVRKIKEGTDGPHTARLKQLILDGTSDTPFRGQYNKEGLNEDIKEELAELEKTLEEVTLTE